MGSKEITVAKAPEHADTGQIAVGGGLQIHVAVAHIDGSFLPYPKLAKGLVPKKWAINSFVAASNLLLTTARRFPRAFSR